MKSEHFPGARLSEKQQPSSDGTATADDSGLRCRHCGYNLTGLTKHRCPECGERSDMEELRRTMAGRPMPIPVRDDRGDAGILQAFLRICWIPWFYPGQFAREFPWCYKRESAVSLRLLTRLAVAVLLLGELCFLMLLSGGGGEVVVPMFVIALSVLTGSCVCEAALASMFNLAVERRLPVASVPDTIGSTSWRGLVALHGSFLIVTALTVGWT